MRVSASNYETFPVNYETFPVNYGVLAQDIVCLYYEDSFDSHRKAVDEKARTCGEVKSSG